MKRDDSVYLRHILDAMGRIADYIAGMNLQQFLQNPLVQDGVIRQLEIMGEATKQLSTTLRSQYNYIPWRQIAGMRDRLIHGYFGVDIEAVWLTATTDVPQLKPQIIAILTDLETTEQ